MDLEPLKIDRSQQRRRPTGGGGGRYVALGIVALLAGLGWLFHKPLTRAVDRVRLPKVRTLKVARSNPVAAGAVQGLAANGYVVAARRAALSADTPGRIVELFVTEGSVVEKGQLVARLLDEEYAAALARADADVAQAKASLERAQAVTVSAREEVQRNLEQGKAAEAAVAAAEADLQLARVELERSLELRAKEINTPREVDQAKAAKDRAEAGLAQAQALLEAGKFATRAAESQAKVASADLSVARARIEVAKATREQAAALLRKTEVRAPFKGIVVLKDAEVGEVVSPNSFGGSNARGSVATLVDFESLEVQADLPETSLKGVAVGAPAQIFPDAFPGEGFAGKVSRIWPTANRQKATIEVRVSFDQLDPRFRPEMGVRVVFTDPNAKPAASATPTSEPAILLPEEALVRRGGSEGAFKLEGDVATFVPLRLGERKSGRAVVLEGVEAGEQVVLSPPLDLSSGDRVRLEEQ